MPTTSPDNIFYEDGPTQYGDATNANLQATSIQTALSKRQSYNFIWANAAARTAQTGMVQSSTGYQLDTKTPYIYDNSAWRLQLQYAEYTQASQTFPNNAVTPPATLTINTGTSTDTVFSNFSGGAIYVANPGIYSMSWLVSSSGATGTNGFAAMYSDAAALPSQMLSFVGFTQGAVTVPLPFYRTTATNTPIWLYMYQNSGGALTTTGTFRIGRLG